MTLLKPDPAHIIGFENSTLTFLLATLLYIVFIKKDSGIPSPSAAAGCNSPGLSFRSHSLFASLVHIHATQEEQVREDVITPTKEPLSSCCDSDSEGIGPSEPDDFTAAAIGMESISSGGDTMDELKGLRISSNDSDQDDAFEQGSKKWDVEDDDDEEEEEAEEDDEELEPVMLGFLEKPERPWSLLRQSFPSKAGGAPAWLDPVNLPSGKHCVCDTCGKSLRFVLQVYAPMTEKESTYHRTLFVFMCSEMSCLLRDQHEQWKRKSEQPSRSVKVFRCQLPLCNPFYSSENPRNDGTDRPSGPGAVLCDHCGTWKGDKLCSRCKKARYCSERHQRKHWKSVHKYQCHHAENSIHLSNCGSSNGGTITTKVPSKKLWPEYEIVDEDESEFSSKISDDTENAMSLVSKSEKSVSMKSIVDGFKMDIDKRTFANFEERRAKAPDQVLRYCRSSTAKPLWPIFSGRLPKADVPDCKYCGGSMIFEFQILSTLLYYFGIDNEASSLDWATVVVYTCTNSCDASVAYKEEFVWVQLY